ERPSPFLNRCCINALKRGSVSDKAKRTLRISPGGGMFNSSRIRPELPPSSATVTIAARSTGRVFKPLNKTDKPVPPPMTATFRFSFFFIEFNLFLSQYHGG